jgi:hypothetical protein
VFHLRVDPSNNRWYVSKDLKATVLLKKDTLRFYPQYLIKLVGSGSVDCEIRDDGHNAVGIASVTASSSVRVCEYLYIDGTFSAMDAAKLVFSRELMLCFKDGDGDWADEFFHVQGDDIVSILPRPDQVNSAPFFFCQNIS